MARILDFMPRSLKKPLSIRICLPSICPPQKPSEFSRCPHPPWLPRIEVISLALKVPRDSPSCTSLSFSLAMTFLKFNLPFSYTHIEIILKNTEQLLCARQQSPCLSEASVTGVEEGTPDPFILLSVLCACPNGNPISVPPVWLPGGKPICPVTPIILDLLPFA